MLNTMKTLQGNSVMQEEIIEMFKGHDDAFSFICRYVEYVHAIDDLVDEEKDISTISKVTELAAQLFNSDYWLKYRVPLYLLERIIHREYFDSVVWENSGVEWKVRDSKVMNQRGYDMIFAVIMIEFGESKLQEFSIRFREYSHLNQEHDKLS